MRKIQLIIALTFLSSAALAQTAPRTDGGAWHPTFAWTGTRSSEHITHNANDCPPDRPEAVWGANGALLGYSCVTPSAN